MNSLVPLDEICSLLRSYADIDRASVEELLAPSTVHRFRKGEAFLRAGDGADTVGFVVEGLFKAYCLTPDGDAYIRNFCSAGYFIGAFATAIRAAPADVTIEAIEPSVVVAIRYTTLRGFFDRSIAWQEFGRKLAEWHYIERETKEYRLLACTALERYDAFCEENAHILGRVPQADIASYIGVAPESLSRLLKARRK
jgi:CRP-like cAMP-binding protein